MKTFKEVYARGKMSGEEIEDLVSKIRPLIVGKLYDTKNVNSIYNYKLKYGGLTIDQESYLKNMLKRLLNTKQIVIGRE
jgi:hypothetical protein